MASHSWYGCGTIKREAPVLSSLSLLAGEMSLRSHVLLCSRSLSLSVAVSLSLSLSLSLCLCLLLSPCLCLRLWLSVSFSDMRRLTYTHMPAHTYMNTQTYQVASCMDALMHVHAGKHTHLHTCTHTCTHMHPHMHTHMHTDTHTDTHTLFLLELSFQLCQCD